MVDKEKVIKASREKLKRETSDEITQLFEQVLDYAQIACSDSNTYKALRSKILRVGNNCIRNVKARLEHYDIEYKATSEDVIEVKKSK